MKVIHARHFLLLFLLFALACPLQTNADETAMDVSILMEAKTLAEERALRPPDPGLDSIQDVRAYLKALDPYSTYISPDERHFLEDMDKPDYSGIGMEVIAGTDGGILCVPFESAPAFTAGVRSGDRLVAVDGKSVTLEAIEILPTLVRGQAGTPVTLMILGPDGAVREVTIKRAALHRSAVEASLIGDTLKIKIYRFEAETPELLRQALNSAGNNKIIIDLRGNIGGELKPAVESVGLLLPPDTLIAKVLGRPGSGTPPVYHRNTGGEKFLNRQIVIWQDHMTASASELFIAALTDNGRAINIGRQSFGKGLVQEVFPVSNGGFFIITTGEIIPPSGHSFNSRGIPPYSLIANDDENEFLRQTESILNF